MLLSLLYLSSLFHRTHSFLQSFLPLEAELKGPEWRFKMLPLQKGKFGSGVYNSVLYLPAAALSWIKGFCSQLLFPSLFP